MSEIIEIGLPTDVVPVEGEIVVVGINLTGDMLKYEFRRGAAILVVRQGYPRARFWSLENEYVPQGQTAICRGTYGNRPSGQKAAFKAGKELLQQVKGVYPNGQFYFGDYRDR